LKYTKFIACCFILILVSIISLPALKFYGNEKVYAYVDIDINPSLEVSISKGNKVLSVEAKNEDGRVLLENLKLEGKKLEVAIDEIFNKSEDSGYIKPQEDNYILISATLTTQTMESAKNLSEEEEKFKNLIDSFKRTTWIKEKERVERIDIKVISTYPEVRNQANENGISMGKYHLYLKARDMGLNVSIEDIKNSSVSDILRKLNMDLVESENNEGTNKTEDNPSSDSIKNHKPNSDSVNKTQVKPSSNSAESGKVNNNPVSNNSQVNSSSGSAQNNESINNLTVEAWGVGVKYDVGTVVEYNNSNYKCIQAHTAESSWAPPNVPALWQKQVNISASNTWQTAVNYSAGTIIIYNGVKYKCIQAHMSMQSFEPVNAPALWQRQ
jgi:hypothetical protein